VESRRAQIDEWSEAFLHPFTRFTSWRAAELIGADLSQAKVGGSTFDDAALTFATLTRASAVGASFERADFKDGNLDGADFSQANLQGANFRRASLQGAFLIHADLRGAVLNKANLNGAWLADANLEGASFSSSVGVSSADFSNAIGWDRSLAAPTPAWQHPRCQNTPDMQPLEYVDCDMRGVAWQDLALEGAAFDSSDVSRCRASSSPRCEGGAVGDEL